MDKRGQHRALLEEIAAGSTRFVFYSRKLSDDQPRNCQFCGISFCPVNSPGSKRPLDPHIGGEHCVATSAKAFVSKCEYGSGVQTRSRREARQV
jgi:hypothetical protein